MTKTQAAVDDQGTGVIQASPLNIGERCHASQLAETGMKMPGAQGAERGQLFDTDLVGQVVIDPDIQSRQVEAPTEARAGGHADIPWQRLGLEMKIKRSQQQCGNLAMQGRAALELLHQTRRQAVQARRDGKEARPLEQAPDRLTIAQCRQARRRNVEHEGAVATIAPVVMVAATGDQATPFAGDTISPSLDGELGGPAGGEDKLVVVMGMGDMLLTQGGGTKIEQ